MRAKIEVLANFAVEREGGEDGELDGPALRTGSAPGRPRQTGQTFVFGRRAELVGAAAEGFRLGEELDVDFEPDDGLVPRVDVL